MTIGNALFWLCHAAPTLVRSAGLGLALLFVVGGSHAQPPLRPALPALSLDQEPITPIPDPPVADPRKLALGASLFDDPRLSHDRTLACSSCHDLHTNGADRGRRVARDGSSMPFDVPTVFNSSLSFRLNWQGNIGTLEAQAESSLRNPANMASSTEEALQRLRDDPAMASRFIDAYGHAPDKVSLLDALATFVRSLLTPGSRFDHWLQGDTAALSAEEQTGYALFKSLGCVSCHQGVNVGGNLYQRHGIFRPLASPEPRILRVPSLRNVATTPPYFHDGSAPTLDDAVSKMAAAQLDQTLSDQQVHAIVAFLGTLTGTYRGASVVAAAP